MIENKYFDTSKYVEVFPQVEKILHFGIYANDMEKGTMQWSPGMYEILGLEPYSAEPNQELFSKCIKKEELDYLIAESIKSKETGKPYQLEFCLTDFKGVHKRLYAVNYLVYDNNGKLKEYNGLLKDISERYVAQKELEEKVALLDKSNASLQEFAYVASHDLNEPLRKILTFIDRINAKYSSSFNEDLKQYFTKMSNSAHNMQILLNELLDFSRLSTVPIKFETINIDTILKSCISDLEVKIEEAKASINIDCKHNIEGFCTQIKQLFLNLLANAIKFRNTNVSPIIIIKSEEIINDDFQMLPLNTSKKYVQIKVSDNGIGFDQKYADKIFQVFQRLNGKSEYSGSGIGLSICKKVCENHHGFIFATSKVGIGSMFTIILPTTH